MTENKKYSLFIIALALLVACNEPGKKTDVEDVVKTVSSYTTKTGINMETRKQKIEDFFIAYEKLYDNALAAEKVDADATAAVFTDCFMEASPLGVICGKNGKEFKEKVEQGYAFYRSIGTESMDIVKKEITILDEYHAMAKIHWSAGLVKKDLQEVMIEFDVIYFLQELDGKIRIFAYIAEDEQKAYKEHGIEPYK
jgi:hypothetical protein